MKNDVRGGKPATMRDVAETAGVALTTVSRAFSDPAKLSPNTLRRIASASADLNYTINLNARALRAKTSGVILVLLPDIGNPFFSLVLKGIEEAARESGRVLLIGDTGRDGALAENYAGQIEARTVDGMILLDGRLPFRPGSWGRARMMQSPLVALSERVAEPEIPYVGIDNVAAAGDVAGFLADLGHRDVAHIAGPPASSLTEERARGFTAGAQDRGLTTAGQRRGRFLRRIRPRSCSRHPAMAPPPDRDLRLQRRDGHGGHSRGQGGRPHRAGRPVGGGLRRYRLLRDP